MSEREGPTTAQAKAEVRKIAEEFPDVVYADVRTLGCWYRPDKVNVHGCIIGFALRRLGASIDEPIDARKTAKSINAEWGRRSDVLGDSEPSELEWLQLAQTHQDNGGTWLACVTAADEDIRYEG